LQFENAEIVFINPQYPNLGGLFEAVGHPQTPTRGKSLWTLLDCFASLAMTHRLFFINPLYPPILGDFWSWGVLHLDHPVKPDDDLEQLPDGDLEQLPDDDRRPPDPRQEVSCTSFSSVSV
jgi:hypothetical protein